MGGMPPTFSSVYRSLLAKRRIKSPLSTNACRTEDGKICTICPAIHLDYEDELAIKNEALRQYFHQSAPDCVLQPIHRAPLGRNYRTLSKRRVFRRGRSVFLGLNEPGADCISGLSVQYCPVEPRDHSTIYHLCGYALQHQSYPAIRKYLNYVIIRGDTDHWAVLFSVTAICTGLLRELNQLSKKLTQSVSSVKSVFVFVDQRSSYYQSDQVRSSYAQYRKIWGDTFCVQETGEREFFYSPLAFSQTNASFVPELVKTVTKEIAPRPEDVVLDLYSGYGLFGLSVADQVREVIGADVSAESIASALRNMKRLKIFNARYLQRSVTPAFVSEWIRKSVPHPVKVILDPPRSGAAKGVIEQFRPGEAVTVVHLICNADLILREIRRWKKNGYRSITLIPFDLFPATDSIEMLVLVKA